MQIWHNPRLLHPQAAVFSAADSMIKLSIPLYSLHLGLSLLSVGMLVSLTAIARIVLRMAVGRLTDHFGEAPLLQASGIFFLLVPAGLFLTPHFGLSALVVTQLIMGVVHTIYWTVSKVYVSKMPGETGKNIGLYSGCSHSGQLVGLIVTGSVVVFLGYTATFAIISMLVVLFGLCTVALPSLTPRPSSRFAMRSLLQFLPQGLDLKALSLAGLCACVSATPPAMIASFYTIYLSHAGYSKQTISVLVTLVMVGMLLASAWSHQRLDRVNNPGLLSLIGISGAGVALIVFPAFKAWLPLALTLLATGFLGGLCDVLYQVVVRRYSPPHVRGTAMAYAGVIRGIAVLSVPFFTGLIASWQSLPVAFVAMGAVLVVLGAVTSPQVRHMHQSAAAASD